MSARLPEEKTTLTKSWFFQDVKPRSNNQLQFGTEKNVTTTKSWCFKGEKKHKFEYEWSINNFGDMRENVESSAFHRCVNEDIKWALYLYPNGTTNNYKDFLSLKILLKSDRRCIYKYNIVCYILNEDMNKCSIWKTDAKNCLLNGTFHFCDSFCPRKFLRYSSNKSTCYLSSGKLTIVCEINIIEDNQSNIVKFEETNNFENLLVNEKFCDVTFDVGGRELGAHKIILAARSDIFAAMFENKMDESISNRVTITDVDYDVFKQMLHFIYIGKAPNLDKMAHDLFVTADKYNLKKLKIMCENRLGTKINIETAVETLILADRHLADQLKKRSMDFLKTHIKDVSETQDFQQMITTYPHLAIDLFQALAPFQ